MNGGAACARGGRAPCPPSARPPRQSRRVRSAGAVSQETRAGVAAAGTPLGGQARPLWAGGRTGCGGWPLRTGAVWYSLNYQLLPRLGRRMQRTERPAKVADDCTGKSTALHGFASKKAPPKRNTPHLDGTRCALHRQIHNTGSERAWPPGYPHPRELTSVCATSPLPHAP